MTSTKPTSKPPTNSTLSGAAHGTSTGHISVMRKIDRILRLFGTAFSFFTFGLGCLLLRLLVFPVLHLLVRSRPARIRFARDIIRHAFRAFIELMCLLGLLHYRIHGLQRLQRNGLLILANHPTLIDTVFLMAFVRQSDCIIKSALWHHPLTGGPVRTADYISNSNGPGLIDDCIASLQTGNNLIIFPEGTRTPADGTLQFKRGAANVAVRSRRNITPVHINCDPPTLGKGNKWWQVPPRAACFNITVHEDIEIDDFLQDGLNDALAARRLTDYLQRYFTTLFHESELHPCSLKKI
jgi:1-acyl-sn-glycerol-3-phosphate acyltransferase